MSQHVRLIFRLVNALNAKGVRLLISPCFALGEATNSLMIEGTPRTRQSCFAGLRVTGVQQLDVMCDGDFGV